MLKTAKLRAQRSGPQLKRRSKGAQTKNPAAHFELPDFERSGLRSDAVVRVVIQHFSKNTVISMVLGHPNSEITCIPPS